MHIAFEDFENVLGGSMKNPLEGRDLWVEWHAAGRYAQKTTIEWWAEVPMEAVSSLGETSEALGAPECHARLCGRKAVVYSIAETGSFERAMLSLSLALKEGGTGFPLVVHWKCRVSDHGIEGDPRIVVGPGGFDMLCENYGESAERAIARILGKVAPDEWAKRAVMFAVKKLAMKRFARAAYLNYPKGQEAKLSPPVGLVAEMQMFAAGFKDKLKKFAEKHEPKPEDPFAGCCEQ